MAASVVDFPEPVAPTTSTSPRLVMADVFDDRREPQVLDRLNFRLDVTEDETDVASLPENIDAEPSELLVVQREVHLHLFFEFAALLAAHEGQRQRFQVAHW